jgi:hypothetical protein
VTYDSSTDESKNEYELPAFLKWVRPSSRPSAESTIFDKLTERIEQVKLVEQTEGS